MIRIATCNFELNGNGDTKKWQAMHERLASLNLDLLLRQELWNAGEREGALHEDAKEALGMDGWPSAGWFTGLYARRDTLIPLRGWPQDGQVNRSFRLRSASPSSLPVIACSYHLSYNSADQRLLEARELTRLADKWWPLTQERLVQLPVLACGGDNNSDPAPGAAGERPQRPLESIKDVANLAHRTYLGPDGTPVLDDRPDRVLRLAYEDVARHLAEHRGHTVSLAPTVSDSDTQGPASRIDRIYTSPMLLPALVGVEIIDMTGLSDHHTVVATFDDGILADILSNPQPQPSDRVTTSSASAA